MSKTVIRLEEYGDEQGDVRVNFRPEEPSDVPERTRWRTLGCDVNQAPFSDLAAVVPGDANPLNNDLVKIVGEAIHKALSLHPGVAQALDRAAGTGPGEAHPIHLLTTALASESLPWEALHHPQGHFLGLDPRFAISRAIASANAEAERTFQAPLRITAVLAAADREASGEWNALRSAITGAGVQAHVTLFLAHDALEAEVLGQHDDWVDVQRVPPTKEELVTAVQRARPHILHIYSHGTSSGVGSLEIATPGSVNGFGDPPIYLEARHLVEMGEDAWLITLDACEGATAAEGMHSLAYTVVESGVPAVIGMREVIDSHDASIFCRGFYTSALNALNQELVPGTEVVLDWARHLATAREALCARVHGPAGMTAGKQKPWTLPVLYRQAEDFSVRTPKVLATVSEESSERILGELQIYRRALADLHPDNPAIVRQEIEHHIGELETELGGA